MEFGSELEEDQQVSRSGSKINPFSSSSSSSPSSSSCLRPNLVSLAQIYDHHQMGSWLATKYGQDESTTASCKVDFMDINVNDDQDQEQEQEGEGGEEGAAPPIEIEKEHMFDKVVTPSDVGKLNRLVIPKQHAEKYFPLDSTVNEKGLLLNFEDRTAKLWRFRYSYWTSSQSYVMTKGWSRFVKDKKLDAGDIVSFQRGIGESGKDKLYIDWRRRPDTADYHHHHHRHQYQQQHQHHYLSSIPWSPLLMRPPPVAAMGMMQREHLIYNNNNNKNNIGAGSGNGSGSLYSSNYINGYNCSNSSTGTIVYMRSTAAAPQMVQWQQGGGGGGSNRSTSGFNMVAEEPINMVYESVPVVQVKAAAKRLRLFGVNMDCPITSSSTTDHDSSSSEDQHHQVQLNLFTGTPIHHKHNNSSTSMSFDLGI